MLTANRALMGALRRPDESVRVLVALWFPGRGPHHARPLGLTFRDLRNARGTGRPVLCALEPSVLRTCRVAEDKTLLHLSICEVRALTPLSPTCPGPCCLAEVSPLSKAMWTQFYGPQSPASKVPTKVPKGGPALRGRALRSACQGLAGHRAKAEPSHRSAGASCKLGL